MSTRASSRLGRAMTPTKDCGCFGKPKASSCATRLGCPSSTNRFPSLIVRACAATARTRSGSGASNKCGSTTDMLARLVTRLFWSGITLFGTAILTFVLVNAVPGDVARVIAGSKASPEVIRQVHARYHLDDPLWKRLGHYLAQLGRGDLGYSFVTDQPVTERSEEHTSELQSPYDLV